VESLTSILVVPCRVISNGHYSSELNFTAYIYVKAVHKLISKRKSKAIPVTGLGGLQSCEMLRISHCLDNRLRDGGKVVSLRTRHTLLP
jgi:hypothetical protein